MLKRNIALSVNQGNFIDFLVRSGALTFGDFVTKSGRKTPYFINTGRFDDGSKIQQLGVFYANHIIEHRLGDATIIFGPAYKGIPLCVATAAGLHTAHGLAVGFSFDRKEVKTHGDGGRIVGKQITSADKIIIVEDVITAGTTMREVVPMLKELGAPQIRGVVIAVDRCERGTGDLSAVGEVQKNLGLIVYPIVTIHGIAQHLSHSNPSGLVLDGDILGRIDSYLKEYGCD